MTGVIVAGGRLLGDIEVGVHIQRKIFGLPLNIDTVWATFAAVILVSALGLYLRAKSTSGVPGKLQTAFEMVVGAVRNRVESSESMAEPLQRFVIPLAITLFLFILIANWFGAVGIGATDDFLPPPAADINFTLALSLFVIIGVHFASIRARGLGGYVRHYLTQPFPVFLFPVNFFMNFIEELAKPLTLALRLFGNILSGGLMLALLASLVNWKAGPIPIGGILSTPFTLIWKAFDLFIGAIQAFIFALLAILYYDTATVNHQAVAH